MSEIKTILVDVGDVLVTTKADVQFERIAELTRLSADDVKGLINGSNYVFEYEIGKLTTKEFIHHCNELLGVNISDEDFADAWNRVVESENSQILDLISKLGNKVQVIIASNTNEMHWIYIAQMISKFNINYEEALSYELGFRKPAVEYFKQLLVKFRLDASNCLFIDDRAENIECANKMGMSTIWHISEVKSCNELQNLLNSFDKSIS